MAPVTYKSGKAFVEEVSLESLAEEYGTPLYVYSKKSIEERCKSLVKTFSKHPTLICYALKANSNLSLLKFIFNHGLGSDVVSFGELQKALKAGLRSSKVVFSGVGKTKEELVQALRCNIFSFNAESIEEIQLLGRLATEEQIPARLSLRINPNINVKTNPYIATGLYKTKFGFPESQIKDALAEIRKTPALSLVGLSCHLGSQIKATAPYSQAAKRLVLIADGLRMENFPVEFLDFGGGFGVSYDGKKTPPLSEYAKAIQTPAKGKPYLLVIEPGRWVIAESGILLSKILYKKSNPHKNFLITDASMTELIRPALYDAFHPIDLCKKKKGPPSVYDVVGPVCETADFVGLKRRLGPADSGDCLWIGFCGAYGASMGSNYNVRPKAAEVFVDGSKVTLIRKREPLEDLWKNETLSDF